MSPPMMEPKEKKQDRYLTVGRVREILGYTEKYVYEMVKEGKLKALRLGVRAVRISEKSLNELVKSNVVDSDEYFGFDEIQKPNSDPVHSRKAPGVDG